MIKAYPPKALKWRDIIGGQKLDKEAVMSF